MDIKLLRAGELKSLIDAPYESRGYLTARDFGDAFVENYIVKITK